MAGKAIAVLKLSKKTNDVIAFAQSVATSMGGAKATFPTPLPTECRWNKAHLHEPRRPAHVA